MNEISPINYFEPIIPYIKSLDVYTGCIEIKIFDNIKIDRDTVITFIEDATEHFTRGAVYSILSGTVKDKSILHLLHQLWETYRNQNPSFESEDSFEAR